MNYADIKERNIANGPGVRVNLFVSGCEHYCKNCFNKEAWDFNYGKHYTREDTLRIIDLLKPDYIAGFTVLGGEPLCPQNINTVKNICKEVRKTYPDKSIWIYTGYTLESLIELYDGNTNPKGADDLYEIFETINVLVDGPFIEDLKQLDLKFRGSSNQRLISFDKTKFIRKDNKIKITSISLFSE